MVDSADNREQASRREPLLHCPKTIGIPPAGDHQQTVGRKAEGSKARPVRLSEFERIPLPLAPEHQALACRLALVILLAMQKEGRQGEAEIPNRRLAAITIGHQLVQSRLASTTQKEGIDPCWVESGRPDLADRSGVETTLFDDAYSPSELGKTG